MAENSRRSASIAGVVVVVVGMGAGPALAAASGPSAIVERIDAPDSAITAFDYLWPGDTVELGDDHVLILGYLESCRRETIVGGAVTVGQRESRIDGATVHAERVPCDPVVASLTSAQASDSGVVVLRDQSEEALRAEQSIRIYSTAPIFSVPKPVARIVVRRLDRDEPQVVLTPAGRVLDTAGSGTAFAAGGRYEARAGDSVRLFEIDPESDDGDGPAVSRLVSF